eukprot:NODE_154_length_16838_cov_0.293327.p7 type:complete len:253 gc:universal NODE_154_length_16838_cov_0.293327:4199-3441(-)
MELLLSVLIYLLVLNGFGFIVSAPLKTERLYDLAGSLSFVGAVIVAYVLGYQLTRQTVLLVIVLIWAIRLGIHLGIRAFTIGDKRFDDVKTRPLIFLGMWIGQVVWAFVTALPVYLVMKEGESDFGTPSDFIGIILFIFGFSVEILADHQKNSFKKEHPSDPIMTGLFRIVRFPNYLGEWILWIGINILCISGWTQPWEYVGLISIPFVFVLLRFGSGVGITGKAQMERYGDRPEFQEYCRKTNSFFPGFKR